MDHTCNIVFYHIKSEIGCSVLCFYIVSYYSVSCDYLSFLLNWDFSLC